MTKRQKSLHTKDRESAVRLINAANEKERTPMVNRQIGCSIWPARILMSKTGRGAMSSLIISRAESYLLGVSHAAGFDFGSTWIGPRCYECSAIDQNEREGTLSFLEVAANMDEVVEDAVEEPSTTELRGSFSRTGGPWGGIRGVTRNRHH
jgi:hypothetical protein